MFGSDATILIPTILPMPTTPIEELPLGPIHIRR